jgi:L-alanine-DL-glutamate epimerase-like enolase superfamily enzyme
VKYPNFNPKYAASSTGAGSVQYGLGRIKTDEDLEGWIFTTGTTLRNLLSKWRMADKLLHGEDPLDRQKIETQLTRRFPEGGPAGGGWDSNTLGVLDLALWDLAGKIMNQPVYKLLGAYRDKILAYGSTMHVETDEEYVADALRCREQGFKAVKLHPYGIASDDIRMCRAVREAVGEKMTLMIDPLAYPGPYTRAEAFKVGKVLDELNFHWFEDPTNSRDLEGLAELRRRLDVEILMGERIRDAQEYVPMIEAKAVDRIRGNLSMGGLTGVMKIAHLADAHCMNCEIHSFKNMLEVGGIHAMLATPNCEFFEQSVPEGVFDEYMFPGLLKNPIRIDKDGYVHAPTKPGLGYDMDIQVKAKITVETLKA